MQKQNLLTTWFLSLWFSSTCFCKLRISFLSFSILVSLLSRASIAAESTDFSLFKALIVFLYSATEVLCSSICFSKAVWCSDWSFFDRLRSDSKLLKGRMYRLRQNESKPTVHESSQNSFTYSIRR